MVLDPTRSFDESFKNATAQLVMGSRVRAVLAAYEKALEDPKFVAPSFLHAAIEALRRG